MAISVHNSAAGIASADQSQPRDDIGGLSGK
jgi:hypothetical protein